MSIDWQLRELARYRLVAATLPGHAGAPPLDDYSIESYARATGELAAQLGADVVAGFSIGACVALEMVTSGAFTGPTVLLGVSLSPPDEPAFFHALVRLGSVLGAFPARLMAKGAASMVTRMPVSGQRQAELRDDFRKNNPQDVRRVLGEYVQWLRRHEHRAARLCQAGTPAWIVHAEKGDGGLTGDERSTLEACASARVVTIPGSVFFLPVEAPERVAEIIGEAVALGARP
jgi:pimeloyl-ACP methyl ester carboxylesterase